MNCERAIALMVEAAEGSITPGDRRDLDTHTAACAACAEAMQDFAEGSRMAREALGCGPGGPSAGFDERVRAAVAERAGARRGRRWIPRLAFAGMLAAILVATISVIVTGIADRRLADLSVESAISLVSPGSIYEIASDDEAEAVEEALFSEAFGTDDLAALDRTLNGDIEETIEELDHASLKALEELLEGGGRNKSG